MSTEYPLDVILLVICFLATAFNFKYKRNGNFIYPEGLLTKDKPL